MAKEEKAPLTPEETIASQEKLIVDLRSMVKGLQLENQQLQEESDAKIEALESVAAEMGAEVDQLKAQLEKQENIGRLRELPSFKIDKVEYRITVPAFMFEGEKYLASAVIENKVLLAELVRIKAGFIEKV